jgi:hypothetical protein
MKKWNIFFLCLSSILYSCGPVAHLRIAERHIEKAKQKGATIKGDTTFTKKTFNFKGAETSFSVGGVSFKHGDKTKYLLKDTVIYKDRIRIKIQHDSVSGKNKVDVKCPDEKKEEMIPVVVNDIDAGYTTWELVGYIGGAALVALVVGIIIGKLK